MTDIPIIYIDTEEDEEKYLTEYKFSIHTKILESIEKSFDEDIESIELFQVVNNLRGFTFVVHILYYTSIPCSLSGMSCLGLVLSPSTSPLS